LVAGGNDTVAARGETGQHESCGQNPVHLRREPRHRPRDRPPRRPRRRERSARGQDRRAAPEAAGHRLRDEAQVEAAVAATVERFGGIDICVNNASAIDLSDTEALTMKRYDLMQDVNARGTFVVSRACIAHLRRAPNPHILTLSPPISLEPRWLGPHVAYTIAKYGMTLCALGFAAELAGDGIASNALWPRTLIATSAVQNLLGGEAAMAASRTPQLYADAAYAVVTRPSRECTGNAFLCEDVLAAEGVTDFDRYAYVPGATPQADLFVDHV
jgi:citronellol/citronellal dehydrogenase